MDLLILMDRVYKSPCCVVRREDKNRDSEYIHTYNNTVHNDTYILMKILYRKFIYIWFMILY